MYERRTATLIAPSPPVGPSAWADASTIDTSPPACQPSLRGARDVSATSPPWPRPCSTPKPPFCTSSDASCDAG